ncbi:MAG: hypothetical protein AB2993_07955 (plasmid) [Candidatus Symbiodolus clandestinus]
MKLSRYITFILPLVIVACSTTFPYYKGQSRAYNAIRAGGIYDTDIYDSEDGMKSYGKSLLMQALNFASLATSFQGSTALGLGGGANFVKNSALILAEPENASARPSLMAWIPQSATENKIKARELAVDTIQMALKNTANDMKFTINKLPRGKKDPVINKIPFDFWEVNSPELGCKNGSCAIAIYIDNPYETGTPEFLLDTIGQKCYKLTAQGRKDYSRIIFYQVGERIFPEKDFYQTLSKNLPLWAALYFPPNSIHQKGEPLTYPVVFEKGEILLFKQPQ